MEPFCAGTSAGLIVLTSTLVVVGPVKVPVLPAAISASVKQSPAALT